MFKYLFLVLVMPLIFTLKSEAAVFSGFCWAQLTSGVYCTPILFSPSVAVQKFACAQYAASMGSTQSGWFRNTSVDALGLSQESNCNYVNNLPKYDCFLEERCEISGNVTSSWSPINRSVFSTSGDSDLARKACVTKASSAYIGALKNTPFNCLIGARAVMTIP